MSVRPPPLSPWSLPHRRAAALAGWGMYARTPGECRLLDALAAQGGRTGPELALALGLKWCLSPRGLYGRLLALSGRGVLTRRRRGIVPGGSWRWEYSLAPGVRRQPWEAS